MEAEAAESDVREDTEGRVLRKADLSLNRIVLRRKLEAALDLRVVEAIERGSALLASPESSSSSRPCPMDGSVGAGEGKAGSRDWLSLCSNGLESLCEPSDRIEVAN